MGPFPDLFLTTFRVLQKTKHTNWLKCLLMKQVVLNHSPFALKGARDQPHGSQVLRHPVRPLLSLWLQKGKQVYLAQLWRTFLFSIFSLSSSFDKSHCGDVLLGPNFVYLDDATSEIKYKLIFSHQKEVFFDQIFCFHDQKLDINNFS